MRRVKVFSGGLTKQFQFQLLLLTVGTNIDKVTLPYNLELLKYIRCFDGMKVVLEALIHYQHLSAHNI